MARRMDHVSDQVLLQAALVLLQQRFQRTELGLLDQLEQPENESKGFKMSEK